MRVPAFKELFQSSKSTHRSSLGSLPFGGDSRIVKIKMARRTGICFRCARHHPVCSPSSVDRLFDGYKLTPLRVSQERIANKTDKRPILRLLGYYERMLAVCKTVGRRDFCTSLMKLHSAQLTSSNRNTNPLLAD